MARIHHIKEVPPTILTRFREHYGRGITLDFYWYEGQRGMKCYGAIARTSSGKFYGNAYQIYE